MSIIAFKTYLILTTVLFYIFSAKDVNININVLNPGNEYDRRQRGGGDNNIYDFPDEGYDNIDTPHRPLPDRPKPGFYEKLKTKK